jgi:NAD(P)-dependent dehydrogenase (short-subunit alcohol dehydrogenase family)
VSGFAEDIKLDELRPQFEANFFGVVAMTEAALPTMRRQRCGHIIQVSSISEVARSSYSASKHALEGWSESLRMEVSSLGIKVVLVEPGAFQTDIWTRGTVMGEEVKNTDVTQPSTKLALARANPEDPQGRPDRGRADDRCRGAEFQSKTALPGGTRREDSAGNKAHSALEVA